MRSYPVEWKYMAKGETLVGSKGTTDPAPFENWLAYYADIIVGMIARGTADKWQIVFRTSDGNDVSYTANTDDLTLVECQQVFEDNWVRVFMASAPQTQQPAPATTLQDIARQNEGRHKPFPHNMLLLTDEELKLFAPEYHKHIHRR